MTTSTPANPSEDWAGDMGTRWLENIDTFEAMIAPAGLALLEAADLRAGETVVDIGCGGGMTTLAAAHQVGPEGRALGLDISQGLIERAWERARASGVSNVSFRCADASVWNDEAAGFDRLISRFGTMFFADPYSAFSNLRRLIRPGGRIDLAVWAAPRDNPWMSAMIAIARQHLDLPRPEPRAPGPFAFEDTAYVEEILGAAGFVSVRIDGWTSELPFAGPGATCADAIRFATQGMAIRDKVAELEAPAREALSRDLEALYQNHLRPGGILMGAKVWLVKAYSPGI